MYRQHLFAVLIVAAGGTSVAAEDKLPSFEEVKASVERQLDTGIEGGANRLLTQGDVKPVFGELARLGWKVAGSRELTDRFLSDGDALVRELRRPQSRELARRIAKYPRIYDRLDRLRKMPYGMRRIREFATSKGGHEMLRYMTTTRGGENMQRQLARGRGGRDFDEPTGRLYTSKDLMSALRKAYDAEVARREKARGETPARRAAARSAVIPTAGLRRRTR